VKSVVAILLICILCSPAAADITVTVRFGHGLEPVAGAITPLVVTLAASPSEPKPVAVTIRSIPGTNLGAGEVCHTADVLSPGGTKEITLFYRPYARTRPEVDLEFDRPVFVRQPDERTPEPVRKIKVRAPLASGRRGSSSLNRYTVLTVGPGANILPAPPDGLRFLPMEEKNLPDVWHAYDGIDAVLLRNPAEEQAIDPGKIDALLRYVELGGRLVITTRRPDRLKEIGLWDFLPADLGAPVMPDITTVELATPFAPTRREHRDNAPPLTKGALYGLTPREGARVIATLPDLGLPLIAERNHGYGSIVVVAFDTARFRPFSGNRAICFYAVLFGGWRAADAAADPVTCEARIFPAGDSFLGGGVDEQPVTDILKLLRAGALRPPPMGLLFLFMVLYILAVGPLDYFVLKKRRLLKWSALTFLGLAAVFSVTAWFVSFHLFAGSEKVNRVTFVDVIPGPDDGPDRVIVHDLAGHYAPTGARLELEPEGLTTHVSDFTEPDSYQGGGGLQRSPVELTVTSPARVRGELLVPFRSLRTTRTVISREITFPLDVEIGPEDVTVRNGLPYDLRDVCVIHNRKILRLGDIPAGGEKTRPDRPRPLAYRVLEEMDQYTRDTPTATDLLAIGPRLQALTWARAGSDPGDSSEWYEHFHGLAKFGLDRSPAIQRGVSLVTAWTKERDPLGLEGGDVDGFTLTIIRKVFRP